VTRIIIDLTRADLIIRGRDVDNPREGCRMSPIKRVALVGNSSPRHCGIATFTTDLQQALAGPGVDLEVDIFAMTDPGQSYDYPASVRFEIREDQVEDYVRAADRLNADGYDVVCLQHEYGIFGGDAGEHILHLVNRLKAPLITTLHTVLERPTDRQRAVVQRLIQKSSQIVVMANKARSLLSEVYGAPNDKVSVVAHGVPDVAFSEPHAAKAELNFAQRSVILTFGLLSPNKGVEVMIDAMPAVLERRPDAVYVVLGATHPHLKRREGEAYRESLIERAAQLGVAEHVVFKDQFVDRETLLRYIAMCDVYVTPYLNEAQMTSGTLAYSFGLGKAVVSTPYWHAAELLADGRGRLVPFGDAIATGEAVAELLTDPVALNALRAGAYHASRSMTWAETGLRYDAIFNAARVLANAKIVRARPPVPQIAAHRPAGRQIGHLVSMCDDTGLFQHAVHTTANRAHGYCVDDNARALLFACVLTQSGGVRLPAQLASRFAAFVQHAWNPDLRRFRNFMSFDRRWLEAEGSEDSHGRTLWALGVCAKIDEDAPRRRWAAELFQEALGVVETFTSPRAWAFTLLGLDAYCEARPDDVGALAVRRRLGHRLSDLLIINKTPDWVWFEDGLAYDNARLPQALIATGKALGDPGLLDAGLRSLSWLVALQTSEEGRFRPVGVDSFGDVRQPPKPFDQQPLEAAATVSACAIAHAATRSGHTAVDWPAEARRAFAWFLGANDLSIPLIDPDTGACRDGLHFDRPNENCGAESVLAYLTSLVELQQLSAADAGINTKRLQHRDYDSAPRASAKPRGPSVRHVASPPPASPASTRPGARAGEALQAGD